MVPLPPLSLARSTPFPWRSLCCRGCRKSAATRASSACWTGSRWRGGASCWCWSGRRSARICSTSSPSRERCRNASPSGASLSVRRARFSLSLWAPVTVFRPLCGHQVLPSDRRGAAVRSRSRRRAQGHQRREHRVGHEDAGRQDHRLWVRSAAQRDAIQRV